jgi:hypothetical protein
MRNRAVRLHLHSAVTLPLVRLFMPRLGVERTLRLVVFVSDHVPQPRQPADRIVRSVRRVARRLVPGAACLAQSITVIGVLSAQRTDGELVLGCHLTEQGWIAHAWVDSDGARLEPVVAEASLELGRYQRSTGWRLTRSLERSGG